MYINVRYLSMLNVVILIFSAILFGISSFISFKVFSIAEYLGTIIIFCGGLVLLIISIFITVSQNFKELFTSDPQTIASWKNTNKEITIFPYILDKNEIHDTLDRVFIAVSYNYEISKFYFEGYQIQPTTQENNNYTFEVNKNFSTDMNIIIYLKAAENIHSLEIKAKFIQFTLFYKSKIFRYKETHIIN